MPLSELNSRIFDVAQLLHSPLRLASYQLSLTRRARLIYYTLTRLDALGGEAEQHGSFSATHPLIEIRATLLDRPLAMLLDEPLYLSPSETLEIGLSRPIAFELYVGDEHKRSVLLKAPSKPLRLTSYGEVNDAMLSYHWVTTCVNEAMDGDEALVPLSLINQTKRPIKFQKLIIHKNFLKLYLTERGFMTNSIRVKLSSKMEAYLEYQDQADQRRGSAELIYESEDTGNAKLLRYLRVKKRGTGVEYGF
jgi:hypothetical protein